MNGYLVTVKGSVPLRLFDARAEAEAFAASLTRAGVDAGLLKLVEFRDGRPGRKENFRKIADYASFVADANQEMSESVRRDYYSSLASSQE